MTVSSVQDAILPVVSQPLVAGALVVGGASRTVLPFRMSLPIQ
jgi:hypothetical protein